MLTALLPGSLCSAGCSWRLRRCGLWFRPPGSGPPASSAPRWPAARRAGGAHSLLPPCLLPSFGRRQSGLSR
ncbi:hypothetical protein GUJ93_ZPchr0006g42883 [Zizania palustris]|uniref:Uncharacterized protein n=1 Tax=Zizania palustris TaxID=103762 RepID=A0A8J5SXF2_ZIZPA|nr:hypothetical protein GUJ93_ZPchr0006g42883 [Zizania palustris]